MHGNSPGTRSAEKLHDRTSSYLASYFIANTGDLIPWERTPTQQPSDQGLQH